MVSRNPDKFPNSIIERKIYLLVVLGYFFSTLFGSDKSIRLYPLLFTSSIIIFSWFKLVLCTWLLLQDLNTAILNLNKALTLCTTGHDPQWFSNGIFGALSPRFYPVPVLYSPECAILEWGMPSAMCSVICVKWNRYFGIQLKRNFLA